MLEQNKNLIFSLNERIFFSRCQLDYSLKN